jgi:hypothetical protein
MSYPLFLRSIDIDSTNNVLMFSENGVTRTATLTVGTYYLRGDGGSDDLLLEIKTKMEAAGASVNTYNIGVEVDTDKANPSATVYFSIASGTDAFALLFAHASNTFEAGLLGFTSASTASDTAIKSGTLSPTALWCGAEYVTSYEPVVEHEAYATVALSGRVKGAVLGSARDLLDVSFELQPGERVHSVYNSSDPTACFSRFFTSWASGASVEFYDYSPDTGTLITAISPADRVGVYHLDADSATRFQPQRLSLATTLYSWRLLLRGAV